MGAVCAVERRRRFPKRLVSLFFRESHDAPRDLQKIRAATMRCRPSVSREQGLYVAKLCRFVVLIVGPGSIAACELYLVRFLSELEDFAP